MLKNILCNISSSFFSGMDMGGESGLDPPNKVPVLPVSILTQFNPPEGSSGFKKVLWQVSLPLIYLFYYTVPDCRLEQWRSWYVITFTMAMVSNFDIFLLCQTPVCTWS